MIYAEVGRFYQSLPVDKVDYCTSFLPELLLLEVQPLTCVSWRLMCKNHEYVMAGYSICKDTHGGHMLTDLTSNWYGVPRGNSHVHVFAFHFVTPHCELLLSQYCGEPIILTACLCCVTPAAPVRDSKAATIVKCKMVVWWWCVCVCGCEWVGGLGWGLQ